MGFFDFLLPLLGAAPTIINAFRGGSTDQQEVQPQFFDLRNEDTKRVQSSLANFITQYLPNFKPGQPFGGPLVAPISPFETQGLGFLQKFLDQPSTSPIFGAGATNLTNTLSGGFDPNTSQYYQALRDTAQFNRGRAVDQTNADLASQGRFFSTDRARQVGDINAQTGNYLNQVLADLANQERNRATSLIPAALQYEQYGQEIPLRRATAAATLGALPRTINQAELEAQYNEFRRQQAEKALPLGAAGGFPVGNLTESFRAYQPSSFEQFILPLLAPSFSGAGRAFAGGF